MAGAFTAVDLSQLAAPDVVEVVDFEVILADMLADLRARAPAFDAMVESDPAYKILEVAAYRETIIRQRVNDAAKSVMLAYAGAADLDQLAALFGVQRLVIDEGDAQAIPPVPPTLEADTDFRRRIQLSLEGFSTAGPVGAYLFHSLSADANVLDASVQSPNPGEVLITVMSRDGDGTPGAALLSTVEQTLSADDVRPLSDTVIVQGATIVNYTVDATLYFYEGPDKAVVLAAAQAAIEKYTAAQHRLGRDVTLSGIFAALHQEGVQRVELTAPAANVVVDAATAAFCTGITLTDGGFDE